jgi:hypothetical protein
MFVAGLGGARQRHSGRAERNASDRRRHAPRR